MLDGVPLRASTTANDGSNNTISGKLDPIKMGPIKRAASRSEQTVAQN
jgi:hypothetical protein